MVKPNYQPWHISSQIFSPRWSDVEKLWFFARYAILAPSGHNTQPWLFKQQRKSLVIGVNPERELPFSGALVAEPYVSLGSCAETLRLAALGYGYKVTIGYELIEKPEVKITLSGKIKPQPELLKAITDRVSNRSLYKAGALPQTIVKRILEFNLPNASAHSITKPDGVKFLADQTHKATLATMSDAEFRKELSGWVRNNATKQHDGMPGFVQGMPLPPSLMAKHIVKRIDISKGQAKKDAKRVRHSPLVVLILGKDTDPATFLDTGRIYAHICILAQQFGLASSGIGAAVFEPKSKREVALHLGLTNLPIALLRVGYATKSARHTPRWPLEKVMA